MWHEDLDCLSSRWSNGAPSLDHAKGLRAGKRHPSSHSGSRASDSSDPVQGSVNGVCKGQSGDGGAKASKNGDKTGYLIKSRLLEGNYRYISTS